MLFELENVVYKDILNIESLQLGESDLTALSGPSGGGKTTLLRLLANLISPDEGVIYYKGKKLESYPPLELREKVKMLAQNPRMLGDTIRSEFEQAAEFARQDGYSDQDYQELMDLMNLDKKLEDDSEELSGGEKQRVALARLMLLEPEMMLLDEPTASLDIDNEKYLLDFLGHRARQGRSKIIMVTHAPELTEDIAQQQVIIEDGRVKGEE